VWHHSSFIPYFFPAEWLNFNVSLDSSADQFAGSFFFFFFLLLLLLLLFAVKEAATAVSAGGVNIAFALSTFFPTRIGEKKIERRK